MLSRIRLFTALAGLLLAFSATGAWAQAREQGRLLMAAQVLNELRSSRDQYIPDKLLERAYAIAVVPDMTKIAFFAGGRHGNGVMVVRDKDGRFGNPAFISLTGGSFGFQWGVQAMDIVLVFTTRKGVEGITGGKFTLGADASVAAGPLGRDASASTDATFRSEVYSYSRTRGVFAGIALDGAALRIDDDANEAYYGKKGVTATDIVDGKVANTDESGRRFLAVVNTSTGAKTAANTTAAGSAPLTTAQAPAAESANGAQSDAPAPVRSEPPAGAKSFPMEDPNPGKEPR
jgi:lipid-binding SYLF domain-containing protein